MKPSKHVQIPLDRSQMPTFEHSTSVCASSSSYALSAQAAPRGHVRIEQSGLMS